ncbi:GTP pyrophosphokinase [Proteus vulgaris]|uniref:GTP pyrophosphokinase n=1 Tax=Proteus vulgaris TaxID=585 RepID=UPI0021A88263|nr:hypothetical protein [Proteus vulgaris]
MSVDVDVLITEFFEKKHTYTQFGQMMSALIKRLMDTSKIQTHSIHHRVKDEVSLKKKIELKDKYNSCADITDLLGVRIICYYSNDIERIESIIKENFDVDVENTIDKRKTYEPDRFGYMSLHYVVSLNTSRHCLVEYREFQEIKFEIQIRTILQHTWAEIEHDLGYKTINSVPEYIRRKFSILSGTLELIDNAFVEIKKSLEEYNNNTKESLEEFNIKNSFEKPNNEMKLDEIKERNWSLKEKGDVSLNDIFIRLFISESTIFNKAYLNYVQSIKESSLSRKKTVELSPFFEKEYYNQTIELLSEIGILTTSEFFFMMTDVLSDEEIIEKVFNFLQQSRRKKLISKNDFLLYLICGYISTLNDFDITNSKYYKVIDFFIEKTATNN